MDVNSIISQIAYLSLDEDSPSSAMQTRILAYVNNAYREAFRQTAAANKQNLMTTETVTITSGAGTMTASPFKIEQVVDTGQDFVLSPSTILEVEQRDRELDDSGNPTVYYMTGEQDINTHPIDSTSLRVRYIPDYVELAVDGAESTIKLPRSYHDLLVDGALFYMYQDERDVRAIQEINAAKTLFDIKLNDVKRYLTSQNKKRKRVVGAYY